MRRTLPWILWLAAPAAAQALGDAEVKKLAEEYFGRDLKTFEDLKRRDEILEKLATQPELKPDQEKRWRGDLLALWGKGRKLEQKKGRHWYWEKPDRGLYIVGGEVERPKGLVVALHTSGQRFSDAGAAQGFYESAAKKLGWLAVFPQVLDKTENGFADPPSEEWIVELLDALRRTWKLDANRVYLTGFGNGGFATWMLGGHHADTFAALAPASGSPTPISEKDKGIVDVIEGVVPNLRNTKITVFQNDESGSTLDANRVANQKLDEAQQKWGGFPHEYQEARGHQSGLPNGGGAPLLAKVADAVRDPRPTKVTWQPAALRWKRQHWWLWWTKPSSQAMVVAEVDKAKGLVKVDCQQDVAGLEVLLDEKLLDVTKEVVVELNGKQTWKGVPQRSLATLLKTVARGDPELAFAIAVPVAGK